MSVLLVTNDSDDDLQLPQYEYFYRQIKELEYNFSSIESSLSIGLHCKIYHCRRRSRLQQCLVKPLFTYMFTLLFLINHFQWSIIFLSLSSIKLMSTYPLPSTTLGQKQFPRTIKQDEQQCVPINGINIDRICSKTCRTQKTPFEKLNTINQISLDSYYLPFCSSYTLNHSINQTNIFNETTENQCRRIFHQLIALDKQARKASTLFATYMEAIDPASNENHYSIIKSTCQVRSLFSFSIIAPLSIEIIFTFFF